MNNENVSYFQNDWTPEFQEELVKEADAFLQEFIGPTRYKLMGFEDKKERIISMIRFHYIKTHEQ